MNGKVFSASRARAWWLWREAKQRGKNKIKHISPIMLRILAVNVMALAILVGGILYLGRYQERLISSEIDSLMLQARLSASALGEGAVVVDENDRNILSPLLARMMIRRLAEATGTRTRLFDVDDTLLADSRILLERGSKIQVEPLPEPRRKRSFFVRIATAPLEFIDSFLERQHFPIYQEETVQRGGQYEIVSKALGGESAYQVWRLHDGGLLLAVAVPVQRYKQVLGAVMLTRPDTKIDESIHQVRMGILEIFGVTLLITILLSVYLARAIARPIRLLAQAAEKVRHGQMQIIGLGGTANLLSQQTIPDLSERRDEIGDLSLALRDMTQALARRISAIENFAADVAHEIKNPLTSLRSAVETAERIEDPETRCKLMQVIRDDVDRLDRLISDISNASRLDAELSRAKVGPISVRNMLEALEDFYSFTGDENNLSRPRVLLKHVEDDNLTIEGIEVRIVQVMQNLISNALSFSPPNGKVVIEAKREGDFVRITVEDEGPGIPEGKLETIFDRFYTERPKTEKFGMHSGLGLSISRQIVEAHHGRIWAENIKDDMEKIKGARFIVELPIKQSSY